MVATSRMLMWQSGSKKSMSPNTPIRNQSIIGGTRVIVPPESGLLR